jgi:integrase
MYQLAYDAQPRRIRDVIRYERLKENDPRDGFVENEQYQVLNAGAEELWLKSILATAYTFGFRSSELTEMKVRKVNLNHRTITLAAGTTKNDDARIVVMTTAVHDLISKCLAGKGKDDYVFTRGGEQVKDFRGAWWALCTKAGLGKFVKDEDEKLKWTGLIFHDLRRSAVRNMIRAGIPEVVAMKISGHKTRSVFDRYNIVSPDDFVRAAAKLEAAAKPTEPRTEPDKISGARLKLVRTA